MEHNYMNEPKPTNRIIEKILGITGSIFGIIGGLIALILTNYDKSYGSELVGLMTIVATSSIILSAITLTLSCLINKRRVLIGIILIVAAIISDKYDGYAECVKTTFNPMQTSITDLMNYLFEIIDPYSINKQGVDEGLKYRTGVYSEIESHLKEAQQFIQQRSDRDKIVVEVLPLESYVKSADEHQDRLDKQPEDISLCHISKSILNKYN